MKTAIGDPWGWPLQSNFISLSPETEQPPNAGVARLLRTAVGAFGGCLVVSSEADSRRP